MGQPNLGPDYHLARRLHELDRQVRQLSTRDVLANSSITHGGLTVSGGGSITVHSGGNVVVTDSGSVEVTGTGKVTVDGLALSSVVPVSVATYASNYALPTTFASVVSQSVNVPAGYSTALVSVLGGFNFANPSATSTEYGSAQVTASASSTGATVNSANFDVALLPGGVGSGSAVLAFKFTGLAGGTITFNGNVECGASGTSNAYNLANLGGFVLFIA